MTEEGAEILALLMDDCSTFEEEIVDRVMRSLERDVIGVDANAILPSTSPMSFSVCGDNCYLQSDSAYSLTSSSARVSDPHDVNANAIGCQCVCEGEGRLGYLMEASDEELGLAPPPPGTGSSSEFEDEVDKKWLENCGLVAMESSGYFNEMVDLEMVGEGEEVFMVCWYSRDAHKKN